MPWTWVEASDNPKEATPHRACEDAGVPVRQFSDMRGRKILKQPRSKTDRRAKKAPSVGLPSSTSMHSRDAGLR